jgi:hypothetical protein
MRSGKGDAEKARYGQMAFREAVRGGISGGSGLDCGGKRGDLNDLRW